MNFIKNQKTNSTIINKEKFQEEKHFHILRFLYHVNGFFALKVFIESAVTENWLLKYKTRKATENCTELKAWRDHMVYTHTHSKNLYIGQGTVCVIGSLN